MRGHGVTRISGRNDREKQKQDVFPFPFWAPNLFPPVVEHYEQAKLLAANESLPVFFLFCRSTTREFRAESDLLIVEAKGLVRLVQLKRSEAKIERHIRPLSRARIVPIGESASCCYIHLDT